MKKMQLKGVVFDLDGVITQTANVHFKAWKKAFEDYLNTKQDNPKPFTYDDDYVPYVDGMPRYEGVKTFLESRGIELPYGETTDPPGKETYCGIGNSKNDAFRKVIIEDGAEVYEATVKFVKEILAKGIKAGVASSSKNCQFILESTKLIDLFETVVDGNVSKDMGLNGKPQPDIFITAAKNMGLKPKECVVVEDAVSGVQAGKNGNFGMVIGITRTGDKRALRANGADIVVEDMEEISLKDVEDWFENGIEEDSWRLAYHMFDPKNEGLREALTVVGNGYMGVRGSFEGVKIKDDTYYPGTYIAGLFNKIPSDVHGKEIFNNDFVNIPNWQLIQNKLKEDKTYFDPENAEILDYKHELDMRGAIVTRDITYKDDNGKITRIETCKMASMDNPHLAAIKYTITPQNYSGEIELNSAIDGDIINYGVPRYRALNSKHIETVDCGGDDNKMFLHSKTNASNVDIYVHAKNMVGFDADKKLEITKDVVSEKISFNAKQGQAYTIEKIASIYTSKDQDIDDPRGEAMKSLNDQSAFGQLLDNHCKAWEKLWDHADINIFGDRFAQKVSRLHAYHLMVTASPHNVNIDAGMPARGLHGEAYRGHIFWDELYILPFFNKHFPEVSKALLKYRYTRLDAARNHAEAHGYKGAMYPWQTADDGYEETQVIHYNPVSDSWGPDLSCNQRHVSIAIAYNILEYYFYTGDKAFLNECGAEVVMEICRFWASIAQYDENDNKYHINGVMGPDEFHEKYPGKSDEEGGINDNAYTNVMVSWLFTKIDSILNEIDQEVKEKINITKNEIEDWKNIAKNLNLVISNDGIISQYDGYFDLKELDWEKYSEKYGNIRRMDRILKAEGDTPDNYKVAKQADTLMIFFLLPLKEVKETIRNMGYHFDDEHDLLSKNYAYYINRTSHGSTLSYIVHSYILKFLDVDMQIKWNWFMEALKSDIYDSQGGTTPEGVHCGVMAGTLDIIVNSFAGINIGENIVLSPDLPADWDAVELKFYFKGEEFFFSVGQEKTTIKKLDKNKNKVAIQVGRETYNLKQGEEVVVNTNH